MLRIYLATPITSVPESQRRIIVRWCEWYIENELLDKDVFCPAIEYEKRWANSPPQTEDELIAIRDRSWQMLDNSDELHVLHPDLSTNAAIEFGYSMGLKLEKVAVIVFAEWLTGSLKDYRLRLLMHKPAVEFRSHSLVELGLQSSLADYSVSGVVSPSDEK